MTPASLDLRSGAEPTIGTYCAIGGAEGGSSVTNCGMYYYELITFGPVLSIAYHRSREEVRVGDEIAHRGLRWRVDRIEPRSGGVATRLICLDADIPAGFAS